MTESDSTTSEFPNPELLAAFVFAGMTTNVPEFNDVARATGAWIKRFLAKFEAEHDAASAEFMERCLRLVTASGVSIWKPKEVEESRGAKREFIRYRDARVAIEWEPDGTISVLRVRDAQTGEFLGSYTGNPTSMEIIDIKVNVSGHRLQDLISYLRETMVLDDIARGI